MMEDMVVMMTYSNHHKKFTFTLSKYPKTEQKTKNFSFFI